MGYNRITFGSILSSMDDFIQIILVDKAVPFQKPVKRLKFKTFALTAWCNDEGLICKNQCPCSLILAHGIRISDILSWVINSYLTQVTLPRLSPEGSTSVVVELTRMIVNWRP